MTISELTQLLLQMQDEKYRQFHSSLLPGVNNILGVRVPQLRQTAKKMLQKNSWQSYLKKALPLKDTYYEETVIQGLLIAQAPVELPLRLKYIGQYLPKISNWAECDIFCATLKEARKYPEAYSRLISECSVSDKPYLQRFAAVMLLNYFTDDAVIDASISTLLHIKSENYYVRMGVAWAISVLYVKQPQKTLSILQANLLTPDVHNKAIQKICESLRVSAADKKRLRNLKRSGTPE